MKPMSDLNIPDIGGTSSLWNRKDRTLKQLRQHLFEVGLLLEKGGETEFIKEAADLLLILKHTFRSWPEGQSILDQRMSKFREKGDGKGVGQWTDSAEDRIDDAVIALLYLGLHDGARAWKGFDWGALSRLHAKGYISDPVGTAKSVVFTEQGLERAERLLEELFGRRA